MREIFDQTRIYLILFALYVAIISVIIYLTHKGEFEIGVNAFHTPFLDSFFYWTTYLGDGIFAALFILLIILFINIRTGLFITTVLLTVSACTLVFKKFVFPGALRPFAFFKDIVELHYVPGLEMHSSNSFPSGHTTQAFCLFFLCAYFVSKKSLHYVFFSLALIAAFSRVYLLQHFLLDIYVGAIIGTIGSIICVYVFNQKNILSTPSLDKPLIKLG